MVTASHAAHAFPATARVSMAMLPRWTPTPAWVLCRRSSLDARPAAALPLPPLSRDSPRAGVGDRQDERDVGRNATTLQPEAGRRSPSRLLCPPASFAVARPRICINRWERAQVAVYGPQVGLVGDLEVLPGHDARGVDPPGPDAGEESVFTELAGLTCRVRFDEAAGAPAADRAAR